MNDAERDAWLREALRHAPDSDALPPSGVSEAILLKARAAARATTASSRRVDSALAPEHSRRGFGHALAAFWAWLARPPVAAGFASVMAATLVGLMWWDRPMDEALPRPPAVASDRSDAVPARPPTAVAPAASEPAQPTDATKATAKRSEALLDAAADDGESRRRRRNALAQSTVQSAAGEATLDEPEAASKLKVDRLAKEQAPPAEKKNEAPTPFPSTELQSANPAANARKSIDSPTSPRANGRLAGDESKPTGAMQRDDKAMARSGAGAPAAAAPSLAQAPAPAAATATVPALRQSAATPAHESAAAESAEQARRPRPLGDLREKDAAAFASPAATAPSPLTSLLATIAAHPERWSRQTAGGDAVALETGWRAWLAELDAAAAPWRQVDVAGALAEADAARVGATTLRIVEGDRVAATVRIEGATVRVDESSAAGTDRWQAGLSPASAERLRAAARRLPP